MTEQDARRILDEIRTEWPAFVAGRFRYCVTPEGAVNVWQAVGKRGHRWASAATIAPADVEACAYIPRQVKARAAGDRAAAGELTWRPSVNHHARELRAHGAL